MTSGCYIVFSSEHEPSWYGSGRYMGVERLEWPMSLGAGDEKYLGYINGGATRLSETIEYLTICRCEYPHATLVLVESPEYGGPIEVPDEVELTHLGYEVAQLEGTYSCYQELDRVDAAWLRRLNDNGLFPTRECCQAYLQYRATLDLGALHIEDYVELSILSLRLVGV